MEQQLITRAELAAVVIRADGSARAIALGGQKKHWEREWERWRQWLPHLSLAAFALWAAANPELAGQDPGVLFGLVTTAGANYLAADFLSGSSARINAFNFQDCGTGTTAMAIGDTALQTPSGLSRVSGTQRARRRRGSIGRWRPSTSHRPLRSPSGACFPPRPLAPSGTVARFPPSTLRTVTASSLLIP